MDGLAEVLEDELEQAVEVKDKRALKRWIKLLTENLANQKIVNEELTRIGNKVELLAEIMKKGFENIEKRFEAVDKRFEDMYRYIEKRFEAVDKRFEDMNKRFEDINKRFEDMNKRFEDMNKRFEDMNKKINILIWVISLWMGLFSAISLILKFWK